MDLCSWWFIALVTKENKEKKQHHGSREIFVMLINSIHLPLELKKKIDTLLFAMGNIFDKLHAKKSDLFHESHSAWFAYHFAFNIFTLVIFVSLDMKWPLIFHSQFVLYFLQVLQNDITIYLELLRKSAFICMFLVRIEKSM